MVEKKKTLCGIFTIDEIIDTRSVIEDSTRVVCRGEATGALNPGGRRPAR